MKLNYLTNDIQSRKLSPKGIQELEKVLALLARSKEILTMCKSQVGMVLGEAIESHLAEYKNQRFSAADFHHERLPDGQ